MVKRGSVEDFGMHRGQILTEVENLILSGDPPRVRFLVLTFLVLI